MDGAASRQSYVSHHNSEKQALCVRTAGFQAGNPSVRLSHSFSSIGGVSACPPLVQEHSEFMCGKSYFMREHGCDHHGPSAAAAAMSSFHDSVGSDHCEEELSHRRKTVADVVMPRLGTVGKQPLKSSGVLLAWVDG